MNRNQTSKVIGLAALMLAGFTSYVALSDTQSDKASTAEGTAPCGGAYYAAAKMTNSSGLFWLTPPANTHTGTFKDMTGLSNPYTAKLSVTRRSDQATWCTNSTTNGIVFPATNSSYTMTLYVTSTMPPPTNGQPLILQVTWQ